jgi:hypothetical protein
MKAAFEINTWLQAFSQELAFVGSLIIAGVSVSSVLSILTPWTDPGKQNWAGLGFAGPGCLLQTGGVTPLGV